MATMTPEGKVKALVKAALKLHDAWSFMPVQNGMGTPSLDFLCAARFRGMAVMFAVETKAPGKKPTPRQELTIAAMQAVGIKVFVIDGEKGVDEMRTWLYQLEQMHYGSRC
jgi:hypothetical protein